MSKEEVVNKDSLNWGAMKKKIEEIPKLLRGGERIRVLYEAFEEVKQTIHWRDPLNGKESDFPVVNVKIAIRLPNGSKAYGLIRQEDFPDLADTVLKAGCLPETEWIVPVRARSRR